MAAPDATGSAGRRLGPLPTHAIGGWISPTRSSHRNLGSPVAPRTAPKTATQRTTTRAHRKKRRTPQRVPTRSADCTSDDAPVGDDVSGHVQALAESDARMRYGREEGGRKEAGEVAALGVEHLGQVARSAHAMSSTGRPTSAHASPERRHGLRGRSRRPPSRSGSGSRGPGRGGATVHRSSATSSLSSSTR